VQSLAHEIPDGDDVTVPPLATTVSRRSGTNTALAVLVPSIVRLQVEPVCPAQAPVQPLKPELAPAIAVSTTVLVVNAAEHVPVVQSMPIGVDVIRPAAPVASTVAFSVALPVPVRFAVSVPPCVADTVRVPESLAWPLAPPAIVGEYATVNVQSALAVSVVVLQLSELTTNRGDDDRTVTVLLVD
jgi:hypothetical protein